MHCDAGLNSFDHLLSFQFFLQDRSRIARAHQAEQVKMIFLSQLHLKHVQPLWMGNHAANYSFTAGIGLDVCLHIVH